MTLGVSSRKSLCQPLLTGDAVQNFEEACEQCQYIINEQSIRKGFYGTRVLGLDGGIKELDPRGNCRQPEQCPAGLLLLNFM